MKRTNQFRKLDTKSLVLAAISTLAVAQSSAALAQAAQDEATGISDIIVTAQKRETSLQKTPLAVSALGGDFVERARVYAAEDLTKYVPNLQFRQDSTASQNNFVIRGIGTGTNSVGVEGSVGVVVDNVVLGREGAGVSGFSDIERIEVLRGPQGTLFGKNASAGVINIITKRPNLDHFEGYVRGSYGNYDARRVNGYITGPVAEGAGFHLSGFADSYDGYSRNVLDKKRVNGYSQYGGRLKFLYEASENLSVQLLGDYLHSNGDCCEWSLDKVIPGTLHDVLIRQTGLAAIGPGSRQTVFEQHHIDNVRQGGVSGEVNWTVGEHTLTSITAYREWHHNDLVNPDFLPSIIQTLDLSINARDQRQFSQEFRLASPGDKPFTYVLGLFYFNQHITQTTDRRGFGSYAVAPSGTAIVNVVPQNPLVDSRTIATDVTKSYAAFGDGTLKLTDKLSALLGFRYSYETKEDDFNRFVPSGAPGGHPGFPPGNFHIDKLTDDAFTYRLGLQYNWTDQVMTYTTYSTGHKGKGVDLNPGLSLVAAGVPLPASSHVVKAEDVRNMEFGVRSTLFDRALQLNVSGFLTRFKNYQGTAFNPAAVTFTLQSVPEIKNDGVEVEAILSLARYLRFNATAAYINSRYTDFPNAPCYALQTAALGCVAGRQNLKGAAVPRSPKYSSNLGVNFEPPITEKLTAVLNANYSWRSRISFAIDNDPNLKTGGYGLLDLSVGVRTADRRYEVTLWGKNVFNKYYPTYILGQLGGTGNYFHYAGTPATYGVAVAARF